MAAAAAAPRPCPVGLCRAAEPEHLLGQIVHCTFNTACMVLLLRSLVPGAG